MVYSHEVERMCKVSKGCDHGPAPIPQEGAWTKVYEIKDGKVISVEVVDTNGSGHGALAGVLQELGVDTLICGGIGGGARNALDSVGITIYGGVSGDADAAVAAFLSDSLNFDPNARCSHHDHDHHHEEGHTCGNHGCGSHSCH